MQAAEQRGGGHDDNYPHEGNRRVPFVQTRRENRGDSVRHPVVRVDKTREPALFLGYCDVSYLMEKFSSFQKRDNFSNQVALCKIKIIALAAFLTTDRKSVV